MKVTIIILFTFATSIFGATKYYDGENRPYEFGFKLEGNQHRHEKKDENGIIMGEFGFITADSVYHVTVYATDEEGKFKVISMRNIKLKAVSDSLDYANVPIPPKQEAVKFVITPLKASPAIASAHNDNKVQPYELTTSQPSNISACSSCKIPTPPTTKAPITIPPTIHKLPTVTNPSLTLNVPPSSAVLPAVNVHTPAINPSLPPIGVGLPEKLSYPNNPASVEISHLPPGHDLNLSTRPENINSNIPNPNSPTNGVFGSAQAPPSVSADIYSDKSGSVSPNSNIAFPQDSVDRNNPSEPETSFDVRFNENSNGDSQDLVIKPLAYENIAKPHVGAPTPPSQHLSIPLPTNAPHLSQNDILQPYNPLPAQPLDGIGFAVPPGNHANVGFPASPNAGGSFGINNFPGSADSVSGQGFPGSQHVGGSLGISNYPGSPANVPAAGFPGSPIQMPHNLPVINHPPYGNDAILPQTAPQYNQQQPNQQFGSPVQHPQVMPHHHLQAMEQGLNGILYKFNYTVGYHGHHEQGDNEGSKDGGYYSIGRDGYRRIVDYKANEFGYQPKTRLEYVEAADIPREETEKERGLQGYEFKWFYLQ